MAQKYQIVVYTDPAVGNNAFVMDTSMDDEQLRGTSVALYTLFGYPTAVVNSADSTDSTAIVAIYADTDEGYVEIDYATIATDPGTMILRGDVAAGVSAANWLIGLRNTGASVTKKYTAKISTRNDELDSGDDYIVQFTSLEFLGAIASILMKAGIDYSTFINGIYEDGLPVPEIEFSK